MGSLSLAAAFFLPDPPRNSPAMVRPSRTGSDATLGGTDKEPHIQDTSARPLPQSCPKVQKAIARTSRI